MKHYLLLALSLLTLFSIEAQTYHSTYDWELAPNYKIEDEAQDIVVYKENISSEFYFEGENFVEFTLEHKVLFLNSDEAIESFNKIYVPYSSDSELTISKARVIDSKGNVLKLDDSKILTATDENTKRTYKYFALEGVEKGSFVEYLYVVKKSPSYKGKRIDMQSKFPKKNFSFHLFAPKNLIFKTKIFNGSSEVILVENQDDKNHWMITAEDIDAINDDEAFSVYRSEMEYLIYALDRNTANNTRDITSYGPLAQNVYNFYNPQLDKKTEKKLTKLINSMIINPSATFEDQIRSVEHYIKTNIYLAETASPKLSELESILDENIANETGIIKLFVAVLNHLNIKHQIVFTSSRDQLKFDKDFQANNFLTDVLLYFPETKKYMAPSDNESRYGFPPAYLTDNYGLFIKSITMGDLTSGLGEIKYIEPVSADQTVDQMLISVSFDEDDPTQVEIDIEKKMSGYYAMYLHPFMDVIPAEKQTELVESYGKNLHEDVEFISTEIENGNSELFGKEPLIFKMKLNSDAFVEKAGNKFLFKVGELIGRQVEMYQEKERQLPVEGEFKRSYIRSIQVNIPSGYAFSNLEDITILNYHTLNDEEVLSFKSTYKLSEGVLTITADEFYRINRLTIDDFEAYRTVINSAADFNKVTLILKKI